MKARLGKLLACAAFITVVFQCSENNPVVAGGEDFPNSLHPAGKALVENLNTFSDWKQFDQIQDTIPDVFASESLLTTAIDTTSGAGKRARTMADSITWDLADTADGIAMYFSTKNRLFTVKRDTVVVLYDDSARDAVFGNERILEIRGKVEARLSDDWWSFWLTDADTNGFLDTARVSAWKPEQQGGNLTSVYATSGNDNNFTDNERVKYHRFTALQIAAGDTTWYYDVEDADGDGSGYDATANLNKIRFRGILKRSGSHPLVARTSTQFLASITNTSRTRIQVIRFLHRDSLLDGRTREISIAGPGILGEFDANDTVVVKVSGTSPSDSGTVKYIRSFFVKLGSDPGDQSQHAMVRFVAETENNGSDISKTVVTFVPAPPVSASTAKLNGSLEAYFTFKDDGQGMLKGTLQNGVIDAVFTAPDNTEYQVKLDSSGVPVTTP